MNPLYISILPKVYESIGKTKTQVQEMFLIHPLIYIRFVMRMKCCPNNGTLSCFGTFVITIEQSYEEAQDYKNGICCFYNKHAVLKSESKDWLAQNSDNVSEWMKCTCCISEVAL